MAVTFPGVLDFFGEPAGLTLASGFSILRILPFTVVGSGMMAWAGGACMNVDGAADAAGGARMNADGAADAAGAACMDACARLRISSSLSLPQISPALTFSTISCEKMNFKY